ncbi:MAG: aminotransferase class I/II-fold pyridoxal phosphate-dependent enzyme, partial [Bilophila sp.]
MRNAFKLRRDMAWKEIASWPGVVCPKPEGAFYLFADISALYTPDMPDATSVCTMLLDKAGVALVPGDPFGDPACVRFSYAVADDVLMDALTRVRKALLGQAD